MSTQYKHSTSEVQGVFATNVVEFPPRASPRFSIVKAPKPFPPVRYMSDIEEETIEWLWKPYLPSGSVVLMFGVGGEGKSTITDNMGADISTGKPWPGQTVSRKPGKVLILSAEDDPAKIIKPRLRKAGADMSRIAILEEPFGIGGDGIARLEHYIVETGANFVVIDPIVEYLGGKVDMFRANEVRAVMGPLQKLARKHNIVILVVGHANKAAGVEALHRAQGSQDFSAAVRSALYVSKGVIEHVKSNYAAKAAPRSYSVDEDGLFEWGPETVVPEATTAKAKAKAKAFLIDLLANGAEVLATEAKAFAADEGIKEVTLNRAKVGLVETFARRINEDGLPDPKGKLTWFWRLDKSRTRMVK